MPSLTRSLVFRELCLGIAGGFRSLPPLGALALKHDKTAAKDGWARWQPFRGKEDRTALKLLSAGEFVTDKLPWTQSRLELKVQPSTLDTGLLGRIAVVTFAGAALGSEHRGKRPVTTGAAFAAAGCILGNFGGCYARQSVVKATGLPDPVVALVEDMATVALLAAVVPDR